MRKKNVPLPNPEHDAIRDTASGSEEDCTALKRVWGKGRCPRGGAASQSHSLENKQKRGQQQTFGDREWGGGVESLVFFVPERARRQTGRDNGRASFPSRETHEAPKACARVHARFPTPSLTKTFRQQRVGRGLRYYISSRKMQKVPNKSKSTCLPSMQAKDDTLDDNPPNILIDM